MKGNKILQMFYFLLFNITAIYAKLPETLFGIKVRSLDSEYIRLIFDQTLDNNAQKQLSTQLSAVLICLDIESNLVPFDIHASKISKLSKKTNKKYDNIEMRTKFEKLLAEIEQKPNNNLGAIDICKLCDFEFILKEVKNNLDENQSRGLSILKGLNYQASYDCNELESIVDGNPPPIWWEEFEKHLSRKNFKYIDAKLALDFGSAPRDIWQWFGQHKIAGESELTHRIRTISARGDVDQINAVKTVMELCMLKYHDMKVLEFQNPLTMAADVLTETSFTSLSDAMFGSNSNNYATFEEECMEFSCVLLKILTYFRQLKDDEVVKNKVKSFWEIFVKILGEKNQTVREQLKKLYSHLNELKNNFGTLTMPPNFISLARSYEKYFIKLHSKSNHFHMMFVEKFFIREKMKSIFQFIDEDKQILSKQFWALFEVEQVSASASSESEIYLPKLYKECPPKLLSEHYGNIDNNDKSAFLIMHAYVQLMTDIEDENSLKLSPAAKEQFQNVEIAVLLWVYNELIDVELFKFANSIEHKNADFVARIDAYQVEWDNVWIKNRQNDNNEMLCCELHKFALEMVEDEALKQNVHWHTHVKSLVDKSTTLYETKLVLLTPENGGINLAQIDCTDNKIATKFTRSIKKVPHWLDQIHYYAITKLITKFVEFQCIFCYGKDHFSNCDMKERLSWIVSPNVFDAIEATFPEILNYGFMLNSRYSVFLLNKLKHKTGTFLSECYEARIENSILLNLINYQAASFLNCSKINVQIRNAFQTKIVEVKTQFYDSLKINEPSIWRESVCLLIKFNDFLTAHLFNKQRTVEEIVRWKSGCDNEDKIKDTIKLKQNLFGFHHIDILTKLLKPLPKNQWFRGQLMSIAGAKTRLWKMNYKIKRPRNEIGVDSEFLKVWEDAGMDKNVFADSMLLPASYECLLISESGNSSDKNAEMLKAEIAVFVQWMEDKFGLARRTIANKRMSRIWDKNKKFFNAIYDQIDDEEEHALALRSNQIRHFIYLMKQDLEIDKKMSELDVRITDIFSNDLVQPVDAEEQRIYQKWMWHLHKCAVIRLIRNDTAFAERLKNAKKSAKSKTAFKQSLIELVGETGNVKEILNEFRSDRTEEIVTENKFKILTLLKSNSAKTNDNSGNLSSGIKAAKATKKTTKNKKKKKNSENTDNSPKIEQIEDDEKKEQKNCAENTDNSPKIEQIEDEEKKEQKNCAENTDNLPKIEQTEDEVKKEQKNSAEPSETMENENELCINANKIPHNSILNEIFEIDNSINYREAFVGITLRNFEDNNFLSIRYKIFLDMIVNEPENSSINSNLQLLHLGIYANEIFNRLKLIKQLTKVLPEICIDQIEKEWNEIKIIDLSKIKYAEKLISYLFFLLKQIVAKMDKFDIKNQQNTGEYEELIVRNQLFFKKFVKFIIENFNTKNWHQLNNTKRIDIIRVLFWPNSFETSVLEKQLKNLEILLKKYEKLNFQRKLDKDFFELYKSDQFLFDGKSRKTNIDLYQIVDGWQQIDFNEAMTMNMKSTNAFKNVCKINEHTEKDTNETFDAIKELRKIFQFWSDEARFQMPALHYLKPNNKTLKPICMLPDKFDLITKIFGSFQCNLKDQMCRDNSLYCILCEDPRVKFLKKHSTVNFAFVPKLEIYFMATQFVVYFVILQGLPQIPKENFDAQQIQIFLYGFGKNLEKLINENYSDEGAYEFDPKKKDQLKRQLEEDVFMAEDDEQILRMLEKIEKLNKNEESNKIESMDLNEYKANARANVKKNREKMEEMKANLTVLWHHALHLKILELLLTKKELYRINHHQFDKDVMNGSTLLNFRTAYAYLELWAKKAQIFNENFGHFNSQIIIIMLTKVFLWFPGDVSVAFLVEKFFLIYAIWDWPLPLHLTKIDYTREGEFLSWSSGREWFDKMQENNGQQFSFEMPIISPMFPEQNLANRIDAFEAKKIQNEFLNAINRIKVVNAGAMTKNEPLKEDIFN